MQSETEIERKYYRDMSAYVLLRIYSKYGTVRAEFGYENMKLPSKFNRLLTAFYLRRRGVEWNGKIPLMDMLRPPQFAVYGRLTIGSGVKFFTHMGIDTAIQVDNGATIAIGNDVVFNNVLWIRAKERITIEDNVRIGPLVTLRDYEWHEVYPGQVRTARPVCLGRNCQIGTNSRITPGVSIGENSIVGESSVVLQSFPAHVSIGGNPARILRNYSDKYVDDPNWIRP